MKKLNPFDYKITYVGFGKRDNDLPPMDGPYYFVERIKNPHKGGTRGYYKKEWLDKIFLKRWQKVAVEQAI